MSGFKKKNEAASPGYYRTRLDKYNIGVELTAYQTCGRSPVQLPANKTG